MTNKKKQNRRQFLVGAGAVVGAAAVNRTLLAKDEKEKKKLFAIGLSQYSLHRTIRNGDIKPADYPAFAKKTFGISDIDVWEGTFPKGPKERMELAKELRKRANDLGSRIFLFMAGILDATSDDADKRKAQADQIAYWLDHAAIMGCGYYRIFLRAADGDEQVALNRAAESLRYLGSMARQRKMKVAIEPGASHWSGRGDWLAKLVKEHKLDDVALMPDFGKLQRKRLYTDAEAMMPYSEVVSAKSVEFNEKGQEVNFDYPRLFNIIAKSGFRGIAAIEYEGSELPEIEGIHATHKLLKKVRDELHQSGVGVKV